MSGNDNNKEIVENLIKAFTYGNLHEFINYLDNNIEWNIIGLPFIKGRNDFIKAVCSLELKNFTFSKIKNIISEGELVVVESITKSKMKSNKNETPAYCDIYRIKDNKIYEITTYIVDTSIGNENDGAIN